MQRRATTATRPGAPRPRRRRLLSPGLGGAASLLAVLVGGGVTAAAAAGPTTHFSGLITSASGRYAGFRGAVRLVLHAATATATAPSPAPGATTSPVGFTLTLSGGPSCPTQHIRAPRRCVALHGRLTGTARRIARPTDVGATFALSARGGVSPLGVLTASGSTSAVGFIARGRFPLTLQLRTAAGRITIDAQGPVVKGFTSPF